MIREADAIAALCSKYSIHPTQAGQWKHTAPTGLEVSFSDAPIRELKAKDAIIEELYATIGQLKMEKLDEIAHAMSDNACAQVMQKAKRRRVFRRYSDKGSSRLPPRFCRNSLRLPAAGRLAYRAALPRDIKPLMRLARTECPDVSGSFRSSRDAMILRESYVYSRSRIDVRFKVVKTSS